MAESATNTVKPAATAAAKHGGPRLTLDGVLADLLADQLVSKEDAERLKNDRRLGHGDHHPLIVLAEQKLKDPRNPKKLLHLEALTEWLAEKVHLPYMHVDPFK